MKVASAITLAVLTVLQVVQINGLHTGTYDINATPPITIVTLVIEEGGDPGSLSAVCAVDSSLALPYDRAAQLAVKSSCCVETSITTATFQIQFTSGDPSTIRVNGVVKPLADCGIIQDPMSSEYTITLRSFVDLTRVTDGTSDTLFTLTFDPVIDTSGTLTPIDMSAGIQIEKDLTVDYSVSIYAEKESAPGVRETLFDFTDNVCLFAEMTVSSFRDDVDYKGIRVHSCYFTGDGNTETAQLYIGSNGCTDITYSDLIPSNTGFQKQSETTGMGSHTYKASLPCFNVFVFPEVLSLTPTCSYDLCFDTSDLFTMGQCGGRHCMPSMNAPTRRRREASDSTVSRNVSTTIYRRAGGRESTPRPCYESPTFKLTVGTLGTLAVILLLPITLLYMDIRRQTALRRKGMRKGETTDSTITLPRSAFNAEKY